MSHSAQMLDVSNWHFPITSLGFGQRVGLWVQGCSIGCHGCMSLDTWAPSKAPLDIDRLIEDMRPALARADGLTISGGEPFDQPEAMLTFLSKVKPLVSGDILLFTGYDRDEIPHHAKSALIYLDVLVSGPFVQEKAARLPLRGSENQQVSLQSQLAKERYTEVLTAPITAPAIDVVASTDGFWLAGVPGPGDLDALSQTFAANGIKLKTSAGRMGARK